MQSNLVNELIQAGTFSAKLISTLEQVRKSISTRWQRNSVKQVQHHLIALTCQNKNLLHYKYLEDKSNNERCLACIIEILSSTARMSKQSRENIACLFLSHVLSHTSCYVAYYIFYVVLEAVPEILDEISHHTLLQINSKIKRQQNADNFKILESIRINENDAFTSQNIELCHKNLDDFFYNQAKPSNQGKDKQKMDKSNQPKIPPLIIPTSKSINSSRYSAISREEKRKGLTDFQKLASSLGQGFISVELGCLLANNRTRQVQQFSQNEIYRQKCLEKLDRIETDRMNSSRLTMNKGYANEIQQGEENAKKYYRKVLTMNLNICLKKLTDKFRILEWIAKKRESIKKKTQLSTHQTQSQFLVNYLHQIFDMSLAGLINLSYSQKQKAQSLHSPSDIFSMLTRNLRSISQVATCMIQKISTESEKLHMYLLLNRSKADMNSHFGFESEDIPISDQFLGDTKLFINQERKIQGQWRDHRKVASLKKYSEPMLLYLGSWLQSLQQLADMHHPMFYFYQTNILKTIEFYLSSAQSKISQYYCAEFLFRFIIMIKREIVELSHPFIGAIDILKTPNSKSPLTHRHPALVQHFLFIVSFLLDGSNRHLERLVCNIFLKNIYFMETIQDYFEHLVKEENIAAITHTLHFYKKCLEILTASSRKSQPPSRGSENSPTYYLFQQIADYFCPRNGCISKILMKYENFISPSNLDECDEQQPNSEDNKFNTQISVSVQGFVKYSEHSIQSYLHEIFLFIGQVYYIACPSLSDSLPILEEDICSFFIKYSIMNFIKLYSLLTVTELANISGSSRQKHELDYMLSTKQSPHGPPKINTKQIFMIDFLKILTSLSINRTPEIAKKFRQYRVLEFFVRQIELEFSVVQNIDKYIKKAVKIRDVQDVISSFQQKEVREKEYKERQANEKEINDKKVHKTMQVSLKNPRREQTESKKISIPALHLKGEAFKSQDTVNQKLPKGHGQSVNKKKVGVPMLNIPLKTEESAKSSKQKNGEKGFLDDMLDEIVVSKNPKKKSFKQELNLNLKLDNLSLNKQKSFIKSKSPKSSDSSMIYFTERKIRKIYSNKVLHAESIMLILCLILYKGQLDEIYCDQEPIAHGKLNVLYILHYHLNHQKNGSIVSILAESVSKIKPSLAGQRLFKLLSNQFTDLSHYHDWKRINAGAFGVIMAAKTHLHQPKQVAIKQMNFPKSIYKRCVLNDIFTEITSLEMFRLEDKVTRMYNYGVIDNTYVIIMRKYACSLRDWRLGNTDCPESKLFPPSLPNILAIFYEVIKGLKLLHEQNVTHYDIKGDNILLEFNLSNDLREPPKVNIVFADFGVAKIYSDEKDELDLKSRGTECIKSPEMLTLAIKNKKQSDNYDRRKKIGTTKASDIWSLGCLLYEIVTGEFLFNSDNWAHFFMQVTSQKEEILSAENYDKMKNNIYLIDFLKYTLIRDPQHRPSIQSILCRFENLYSLLVANPERVASSNLRDVQNKSLSELVKQYYEYIKMEEKFQRAKNIIPNKRLKSEGEFGRTQKVMEIFNSKVPLKTIKIMQDIYFCESELQVIEFEAALRKQGITHIIVQGKSRINKSKFKVIEFEMENNSQYNLSSCYRSSPRVSDTVREVLLMKGKLLFVNSQSNFCVNLLVFTLSYWFKCSAYETWCLINTQILQFPAFNSSIISMSHAANALLKIEQELHEMPKLQCICGSVTIILKNKFQDKRGDLKVCKCKKSKGDNSGCFSKNCQSYLELIQRRYNIVWDHLTWALAQKNQLLTPLFGESPQEVINTQIMLNSANPLANMSTDSKQAEEWKIYQCKTCEMWMMATNSKQIWLILNNLIKSSHQGIMIPNAQQDFKSRTPALNYYTLSKLHMTQ